MIDKIRERLPDDEEVLNEFLVRSLAIFMLLRNFSIFNPRFFNLSFYLRFKPTLIYVTLELKHNKDSAFTLNKPIICQIKELNHMQMTDQTTNQKLNLVSEKLALVSSQWKLFSISIITTGTESNAQNIESR